MVLGTAQLGQEYGIHNLSGKPSEETAYQILDYAWRHGVRTLDTAGAYGDAENLIGKYQETTGHFFHIGTKLIADTADGMVKELEKSCGRLRCSQIWLCYLHRFGACKEKGILQELERWKAGGKVQNIGISVYEPEELEYIVQNLSDSVDAVQVPFHLLDHVRWLKGGLLQRAKEKGIQIFARSVYLQGLFLQSADSETARRLLAGEALSELGRAAGECGMDIRQLAVSFVFWQPEIDEFLLGCETLGQLAQNLALEKEAGRQRLPDGVLQQVWDISKKVNDIVIDPRTWDGRR